MHERGIRSLEYKAIRSHQLSMQGLIDAWTEIGDGQPDGRVTDERDGEARIVS
jgi:hypothetical protein